MSFYTCVPKTTIIIWVMVPEIRSETDRQNFFHFEPIFSLLSPSNPENQNFEKTKKHLEMSSFYKCVPKIMIIWCMLPEIWSETDMIFCHFGSFFALLLRYWLQTLKFGKDVKIPLKILSFYIRVP